MDNGRFKVILVTLILHPSASSSTFVTNNIIASPMILFPLPHLSSSSSMQRMKHNFSWSKTLPTNCPNIKSQLVPPLKVNSSPASTTDHCIISSFSCSTVHCVQCARKAEKQLVDLIGIRFLFLSTRHPSFVRFNQLQLFAKVISSEPHLICMIAAVGLV